MKIVTNGGKQVGGGANLGGNGQMSEWERTLMGLLSAVGRVSYGQVDKMTNIYMKLMGNRYGYVNAHTNTYFLRRERRLTDHEDGEYFTLGYPTDQGYSKGVDVGLECALDNVASLGELASVGRGEFGEVEYVSGGRSYVTKYVDYDHVHEAILLANRCTEKAAEVHGAFPEIELFDCMARPVFIIDSGEMEETVLARLESFGISIPHIVAVTSVSDVGTTFRYMTQVADADDEE